MVFSFFKKSAEKMVTRPAAAPPSTVEVGEEPPTPVAEEHEEGALSDFVGLPIDFHVDDNSDPVDAPAEEAAVLFANNQDSVAQIVLESALESPQSARSERLWLMLFDLYRLLDQQSVFEAIGIKYARVFEKSPPNWGNVSAFEPQLVEATKVAKSGRMLFKGDLLGGNQASFDAVEAALKSNPRLRLDLSRVKQVDDKGCACLLRLLSSACKGEYIIELSGRDGVVTLVKNAIEAEKAKTPVSGKGYWLLLLELFQQQGQQEPFEDLAIDYAITFEESPPSWEFRQTDEPEPIEETDTESVADEEDDGSYVLSGEVKSQRFGDLVEFAQAHDLLVIDCSKLTRIDFVSAGVLMNVLVPIHKTNTSIIFRHPNYLVAELFRVVGLNSVATIVFAKH